MRFSTSRAAKLIPQLKELRIHLCQTSKESQGIRDYIQKNYVQLKKDNPALPILIRECSGVQPKLWARFEMGKETCVPLTNQSAADIAKQIDAVGK